ncbi:MAG: glycosyltransferase family 2 protein [Elusimicrobiota bacterium]|mgnify:CR=1 FL=1
MISVIVPVYNEAGSILQLADEIKDVMTGLGSPWEAIFVDDASTDASPVILAELKKAQPRHIGFIRLARNSGQSAALACGIDAAKGDVVVTLDGDGQNDPTDIPRLLERIASGSDVVCGWRRHRQDTFTRRIVSRMANALIAKITGVPIHDHGCTLRAYKRAALTEVQLMGEMHRLLPAFLGLRGLDIDEIEVNHRERRKGNSKYGLAGRTLKVTVDLFLLLFYQLYLTRPMHIFGYTAVTFAATACATLTFVIIRRIFFMGDWMSPLFFLGLLLACAAILFLFLGALADMICRNYMTAHGVKPYRVRESQLPSV